jgi:hypothetical protein
MSADQYLEFITLNYMQLAEFDNIACDQWILDHEFRPLFNSAIDEALKTYGYSTRKNYSSLLDVHVSKLVDAGIIKSEGDDFTGAYSRCDVTGKDNYLKSAIGRHPVSARVDALGESALRRALEVAAEREGWSRNGDAISGDREDHLLIAEDSATLAAPASDRIVTFSDNQSEELDAQTTEMIRAVEAQNQLDDSPGLRELLLGQLKAGREFIRAGSFKLYFIQITLIDTLRFLAQRYEKEAIGGLAAALITALIKHIGIDA